MSGPLNALDTQGSRKNGLLQMVCGVLCIFFNIVIFVLMGIGGHWHYDEQKSAGGLWGGVLYVTSGALIFVAAKRRTLDFVIPALVMNVVSLAISLAHLSLMSVSVMSWEREHFEHATRDFWSYPAFVSLFR